MALLLQDKFGDVLEPQFTLDGVDINVPPTALDNAVDQLMALSSYSCENEHELSSLLTRTMDRFLFCDDDIKLGAALSQFPLQNTRRADLVVVKLEDWVPSRPVIATNDSKMKSESFDVAVRETQCSTGQRQGINANAFAECVRCPPLFAHVPLLPRAHIPNNPCPTFITGDKRALYLVSDQYCMAY